MSLRKWVVGILGLSFAASGCVSTQQYEEMRDQYMQENTKSRRLIERNNELEGENRRLRNSLQIAAIDVKTAQAIAEAAQAGAPNSFAFKPSAEYKALEGGGARLEELTFSPGSAKLTDRGMAALDAIAEQLKGKPAFALIVDGHTDSDPIVRSGHASNWELSGKRAAAVVDYLVKKGTVDAKNTVLRGFGEFRPLGEDKAKNRRVEIYAVPTGEGAAPTPAAPVKTEPPPAPAPAPVAPAPKAHPAAPSPRPAGSP